MKKSFLILAFIVFNCAFAKADNDKKPDKTVHPKIEEVTVFLNGANIKRSTPIPLLTGTNTIKLEGLATQIDERSIQISGLGDATILSINYGIDYLSEQPNSIKADSLQNTKVALELQISRIKNVIVSLQKEEEVLGNNRTLGSNTQEIDLEKVKALATYYSNRIREIRDAIYNEQIKSTKVYEQINQINKELQNINVGDKKSSGQIVLKINSERNTSINLTVDYNVSAAGWFPMYDIKATDTDSPISMSYKAHLIQKTGVSWENAKLFISTGNPRQNTTKPTVNPKYLNFINPYAYRNEQSEDLLVTAHGTRRDKKTIGYGGAPVADMEDVLKGQTGGVQITQTGGTAGGGTDVSIRGYSSINGNNNALFIVDGVPYSNGSLDAVQIGNTDIARNLDIDPEMIEDVQVIKGLAAATLYGSEGRNGVILISTKKGNSTGTGDIKLESITTTKFEIKKRYTIHSDDDATVIEIDKFDINASYEHYAAPVLNEDVFLTAKLKNWEQYSLLPGDANIYFEGTYSGKTYINPFAVTEDITVSLGIDPNVTVKRKQLDNFKAKSFTGGTRIVDNKYEISVKNNKSVAITLTLLDRIPISQNKEIKIDDVETEDAKYDDKTGIITWELNMAPLKFEKKTFSYELRFPKHKSISL